MTEAPQTTAAQSQSPAPPDLATAWVGAMEDGAKTWLSACTGLARAFASVAESQADCAGAMMKLWSEGAPRLAEFRPDRLFREGLLMAEGEAAHLADAAHRTLIDLAARDEIPPPLPE